MFVEQPDEHFMIFLASQANICIDLNPK